MKDLAKQFIEEAVSEPLNQMRYLRHFSDNKSGLYPFSNEVSLAVARGYLDGELSFQDADAVANAIYSLYIGEPIEIPEPAFSIYLAFDSGEYGGEDQEADVVRPALKTILDAHER